MRFAAVAQIVQQLNAHAVSQLSSSRGEFIKASAHATLFDRLTARKPGRARSAQPVEAD
jgi:hypothetical protein